MQGRSGLGGQPLNVWSSMAGVKAVGNRGGITHGGLGLVYKPSQRFDRFLVGYLAWQWEGVVYEERSGLVICDQDREPRWTVRLRQRTTLLDDLGGDMSPDPALQQAC